MRVPCVCASHFHVVGGDALNFRNSVATANSQVLILKANAKCLHIRRRRVCLFCAENESVAI